MKERVFEFVDLDDHKAFLTLGKNFGGYLYNGTLFFNNDIVCGELCKVNPEKGLWIRKWKLTLSEKITLRKLPAQPNEEKKFCLVYFLNPSIFELKSLYKGINLPGHRNNLFLTSDQLIDFSVLPKQPFYVLDIAFTLSWLNGKFAEASSSFRNDLNQFIQSKENGIILKPCTIEEYKLLREFELNTGTTKNSNAVFVRARAYKLIIEFFCKLFNPGDVINERRTVHYEQVMEAEKLVMDNIAKMPCINEISHQVNLSASSLRRQFHLFFGMGIEDYHIIRKMEVARNLLLQNNFTIKKVAHICGYKQVSAFIEMFARQFGYSPGTLKSWQSKIQVI